MNAEQPTLFGADTIEDAKGLRWVVRVNEVHLFCYGGTSKEGAEWWALMFARPGILARTTHLIVTPPGDLLYLACDDQEEAEAMAEWMHSHGCSPKAVKALRIGHPTTCVGCATRRPFWHRSKESGGSRCRPCFEQWVTDGCPIVRKEAA